MNILSQLQRAKLSLAEGARLFKEGGLEAESLEELQQQVKDLADIAANLHGGEPEDYWPLELLAAAGLA